MLKGCGICPVSGKTACPRSQTSPAVVTPLPLAASLQTEEVSLPSDIGLGDPTGQEGILGTWLLVPARREALCFHT